VRPILVQDQAHGLPLAIGFKTDLGVDHLQKELPAALRENLELWLVGGLGEEVVPFQGDRQDRLPGNSWPF
jgi:hypothetical protein